MRAGSRFGPIPGITLFATAIFASAFLIFLVQPMVGKRILPWFGGAPGAWTVCLAFYQVTLFLGYAYAHGLMQLARPCVQLGVHGLLVAAAVLALPVLPGQAWASQEPGTPMATILAMLTANVALPFLTLAATGPLVQAWFARGYPGRSPYALYAVSNVGSLLALLSYPFLIEPRLSLLFTGRLWSIAFVMTGLTVLACALLAWRIGGDVRMLSASAEDTGEAALTTPRVVLWLLLSGTAVVLLMGVTNTLCIDIASFPFLWILPLVVYLVSFILCFGFERSYRRAPYIAVAAAVLLMLNTNEGSIREWTGSIAAQISLYCLLLFTACMVMHGELYRLRPAPRSLTVFYLCTSGGGALGGIFAGIVAPHLFDSFHELPLGLGLAWLLVLAACRVEPKGWLQAGVPGWRWLLVGGLSVVLLIYSALEVLRDGRLTLHRERTFFGLLQVIASENYDQHVLMNGTTMHGVQFRNPAVHRRLGTSYYGPATGIATALLSRAEEKMQRVGVVGLGVGTLAVYGRKGDLFRFYEIDPAVIRLASDDDFFSFLADSRADIEVVPGDARLVLMSENDRGSGPDFDVIVLDAFSSDSIPVHLLTREAFEVYDAALDENGLIAVHISNRHFELWPLVLKLGQELGMNGLKLETAASPQHQSQYAQWCFLGRDEGQLHALIAAAKKRAKTLRTAPPTVTFVESGQILSDGLRVWTDDYSDLLSLLNWRSQTVWVR